jgi:hypothetical protein
MTIYRMTGEALEAVRETTFASAGVSERNDLQRLLKSQIEIISEGTLIIAEEFSDWEDSRRRIDLLGVDPDGTIVVIELKRTEDGGHMELQAIRYAAMVSTLDFDRVVRIFESYLKANGDARDAREVLVDHLDDANEDSFAQDVRIVLASAEFSRELTTSVLWLNDRGLDIRCVRIKPYGAQTDLLLDVQQIIPLPDAQDYITRFREKQQKERQSRSSGRDTSRYSIYAGETCLVENESKRRSVLTLIRHLCDAGISPEQIAANVEWKQASMFRSTEGDVEVEEFVKRVAATENQLGRKFMRNYYFLDDDDLFLFDGKTYAVTKRWGPRTDDAIACILSAFPQQNLTVKKHTRD